MPYTKSIIIAEQVNVIKAEIITLKAEKDDLAKINEALVAENTILKAPVK